MGIKNIIIQLWCFVIAISTSFAQNVGIGIISPAEKLEVGGNIKATNLFSTGSLGIGTTTPSYKLHIVDGVIGMYNSGDDLTWTFTHYSQYGLGFSNGTTRMIISNAGNVGIGNSVPAYKLDVNGNLHTETNAVIDGNLTVNNGRGIIQNTNGAGQLKYYTRTAAFGAILNGFQLSSEGSIGFASAGFTSPPKVFVGDIVSTGGTVGELYRVQLVIYDVTTTSCKARLLNTSPNAVNYNITWNIVCIGE